MKAADNGEFSGAIERAIDEKIKDTGSTKTGQQSALGDFKHRLYSLTQGAAGTPQLLDVVDDTPIFRLFSTKEDFDRELDNWRLIDKLNSESPQSALATYQELWCRLDDMLNKFSYYSYLTPAVKYFMIDGYRNDCESVNSLRPTFARAKDITSPERWNTARIEELLSTRSPPLKDVLPPNAAQLVGQLDTMQPADRLAVGGFATLYENELVQALSIADNGLIKIRTTTGSEGFVDARAIIAGRAAVAFSVKYKPGQVGLESNRLPTGGLLGTSLITDVLVQYPESDGSIGFTRAQHLASLIEDTSNGGSSGMRNRLVVSVRSINAEQRKSVLIEAIA